MVGEEEQTAENADEIKKGKKQRKLDALERIPIEGKFGQGKNGYRLNYIRARTLLTSEAWINSIFLVMNLLVLLRMCCIHFFGLPRGVWAAIASWFNRKMAESVEYRLKQVEPVRYSLATAA